MPLFYLFYDNDQIDPDAYKIGSCEISDNNICPDSEFILSQHQNYIIYDLSKLNIDDFQPLTAKIIYNWLYTNYQP
jgi:hypothetical protein